MSEERWVPVKGFEGRYECSTLGRLRSVAREWRVGASTKRKPEQLMKPAKDGKYRIRIGMMKYCFIPEELKKQAGEA